ncbi:UNVERIFIED_ORG: hypothetical protein ABID57_001333 [Arthrobacter sp. UYEF1]
MQHLTESVRTAVQQSNWYAALGLALTLPDICSRLEAPHIKQSQPRYVIWCNTYIVPGYTSFVGPEREEHIFLSGEDCYALRCAVLHEGRDDIVEQKARQAIDSFNFTLPMPNGNSTHRNLLGNRLQLEVHRFCWDICDGADRWNEAMAENQGVQERIKAMMRFTSWS